MTFPFKKDPMSEGFNVWMLTCGFNRVDIAQEALARIYCTKHLGGEGFKHVFLNQHYPFDKKRNAEQLRALCEGQYGGRWMDAGRNLGLHEGLNYMLETLGAEIGERDYIIMADLDNYPREEGWDEALIRVLHADPTIGQTTLWNPTLDTHPHGISWHSERVVNGIRVKIPNNAFVRTITAWRAREIRKLGGWIEPVAFWGHLESAMTEKYRRLGLGDAYLPDFFESSAPCSRINPEYHEWKVAHAHHYTVKVDLEQWLRDTGRAHLIGPD